MNHRAQFMMKLAVIRARYRSGSLCQCCRYFCSKKPKSDNKTYSLHFELKQLYGAVVRDKNTVDKTEVDEPVEIDLALAAKESKSLQATEIYWLTGHAANPKNIRIRKSRTGADSQPPAHVASTDSVPQIKEDTKSLVTATTTLLRKFISSEPKPSIPFDQSGLESIPKYPLLCQKVTTNQLDEALSDRLPSISKILSATMPEASRYILKKWKLAKIAELGEDGFREYEQMTLKTGQLFHSSIQNYFDNKVVPDASSPVVKLWQSVGSVLVELDPKPILTEKSIVHPNLKYKGIIDSVAVVKDTMCALEWKTSEKSKPRLESTFDAPIQLCAYLGALNADPRYDISARNGYVVVAYKDGTKANAFYLSDKDVRKYWALWLQRVQEFWIRTRDGTLPEPI